MDFRNPQPRILKRLKRLSAIIKLEGKVTGVIVDPDTPLQEFSFQRFILTPTKETIKEGESFFGILKVPERLWLKAKVKVFSTF